MKKKYYDTLSEAVDALTKAGFEENFEAADNGIKGNYSGKTYAPGDLRIVETHRFEGMTNPDDASAVFALLATDGNKGTLVMSFSADHSQDAELIRQIPNQL